MTVIPDTKDWTWVLQRPCPECGLDTGSFPREAIAAMVRDSATAWASVLTTNDGLRDRPAPGTWSPLEYTCHVRDVYRLYDERLRLMLETDDPHYPNWDQDAAALAGRYPEQDPAQVLVELTQAAAAVADRFDTVTGEQWHRTGVRGDGARFTIESFARYFIHDPIHHLADVSAPPLAGPFAADAGGG
jgi:DinB family protein